MLLDITYGVDFKKIDQMALEIGIASNDEKRIESAITYSLAIASNNGNTCVEKQNLIKYVQALLGTTTSEIETALINLKARAKIEIENVEEIEWVYLNSFYVCERNIAQRISILNKSKNIKKIKDFDKKFKEEEKHIDITLSEKQKETIKVVNDNNVCVITGGPGTGKTTIIKTVIELYEKQGKKVVLCAPTGRAAKRMTETTGKEAKTLHRLLEIGKQDEENKLETVDRELAPLDADVVIADEMSMVDIFIMNYLVKALYQGTKLVLVGDVDQLPSVGPGSILKDMINSEKITTITLNKIFRQAAKSKIILNSHRVNEGENFLKKEDIENEELNEDFFYINEINQEKILHQVITLCNGRLKNYGDYDFFKNIQVITPTKKGMLGTKELNKTLQKYLNPLQESLLEKQIGDTIYREQDRVMQIKNNYDIFWERTNPEYETGSGVFNGELGTIIKIDDIEKVVKIKFDDEKEAWYSYQDLDQIEHSYAITIHKAQRK